MAQHINTTSTILKQARIKASDKTFAKKIHSENTVQWILYTLSLILIITLLFLSSYFVSETASLLSKLKVPTINSILALPIEYLAFIGMILFLISKFNSTWFNQKRIVFAITAFIVAFCVPLLIQVSLPKNIANHPLEIVNQKLILSAIQLDQKTFGTIAKADLISGTSNYLVTVINSLEEKTYIMPNPPFVPTSGQKLWLSYSYKTVETNPTIQTMGLLN